MPRPARPLLVAFAAAAVGFGAARALTTTYVPVLLDRIHDAPWLIGLVMLINAAAGLVVPLVAGVVTDRRRAGRFGRRGGILLWGAAITGGGLLAVATGIGSSYLALAAAAAAVYTGLNVATTAHRAVVADAFAYENRPRVTGAQELAALAGSLVGTVAGGALIDGAPAIAFILVAVVVAASVVPTVRLSVVRTSGGGTTPVSAAARPARAELLALARTPGAREVLLAQVLWVTAYGALPTFLVLYADHVLGVGTGAAAGLVVLFGALTGAGTLLAARLRAGQVERGLLAGVALMGVGALAVVPASSLAAAAVPFALVALGEGLTTALGYPYFTRFVPDGVAGRAAGLFFSVRSIGSAIALPVAGGLAAVAGYRWIWALGAAALLALIPLARTLPEGARRRAGAPGPARPAVRRVAVVIPYLSSDRVTEVARRAAAQPGVAAVLLVDDGAPPAIAGAVDALAAADPDGRIESIRPGIHQGKPGAVAAGMAAASRHEVDALVVVDSDAQHPPERLPAFLAAAADADVVVGHRTARRDGGMPLDRRIGNMMANVAATLRARHRVPDSQSGMRLYRLAALDRVPLPGEGGYEAETTHLLALLRSGEHVAWVTIPTIYNGEPSGFRAVADTARVALAIAGRMPAIVRAHPLREHLRIWLPRLGLTVAFGWLVAALLPLIQPLDDELYLRINHLGDGPDWLYDAVDPHLRNYLIITALAGAAAGIAARRVRRGLGAAATVALSGMFADLLMQVVRMWTDRPRPEEVLGSQAWLSHGRDWSHIASFPSGHLVVTSAMVVAAILAAPALRHLLVPYLMVIAATRILFGAHFPSDVLVGLVVGTVAGAFVAETARVAGALPAAARRRAPWRRARGGPRPAQAPA